MARRRRMPAKHKAMSYDRMQWPGYLRLKTDRVHRVTTLPALIRKYLFISLFRACAESLASDNASRLAAMERANRISMSCWRVSTVHSAWRQSGIDEELFDVISASKLFVRRAAEDL